MKQLIFSVSLCVGLVLSNSAFVYATTATPPTTGKTTEEQQKDLLDYINNPPAGKVETKYTSAEIKEFLGLYKSDPTKYISSEDEAFLTYKPGQSASDFIKAIQIENAQRSITGQSLLPDPTVSTNANTSANTGLRPPLDGPAPNLNQTMLPVTPTPTAQVTAPTSNRILDALIPRSMFGDSGPLNTIFNQLFYLGLIIAIILAIIMIIRGGVEYMTIDAIASKDNGKKRVQAALGGLLLAFSAILILNTINPSLTQLNINFPKLSMAKQTDVIGGLYSGVRIGTDANGNPIYASSTPIGGPIGANFKDEAIKQYTLDKIKSSGLAGLSPSDKAAFFPNGGTDEEWLALVSAMATHESGQDPSQTYTENFKDSNGNFVTSTGLLQLSQESVRGYSAYNPALAGVTTESLKNPQTNIDAGVTILKRLVERDGCISCQDAQGNWKGGSAYWSVLRSNGKLTEVKNTMMGK